MKRGFLEYNFTIFENENSWKSPYLILTIFCIETLNNIFHVQESTEILTSKQVHGK
jgi:hypothetical protein